jgi:EAL domain-containing protein (putative c-di-GMP-specific phosphodiesterase class I)
MTPLPISVWQICDDPAQALPLRDVVDDSRTCRPGDLARRLAAGFHLPDLLLFHRWDAALAGLAEPLACVFLDARAADAGEIVVSKDADAAALARAFASSMSLAALRALRGALQSPGAEIVTLRREVPALDQFALHFQPQWTIDGDALTGAEALLRWHGLAVPGLAPDAIVARAEARGEMACIGDWIFDRAAWHLNEWLPFWPESARIAVNVCAAQLDDRTFVDRVDRILARHQLDAHLFELEIGAHALGGLGRRHADVVGALAELGFSFALDRLGDGMIERRTLEWLPAHSWKLDRTLVARADESDAARLIETITNLARELGIRTVAVGVEDARQQARVAALGCDALQGFLLAEALPPPDLAALLVAHWERSNDTRRRARG